jgi:DNA adenine methylase
MSKAPITWFGGKSRHLHWMLDQFPSHRVFVDAFGGSGAVLLGKPESAVEVYNDIDGRLVNLFRVLRDSKQSAAFELATSLTAYSREEFELAKLPSDDPVESARRFFVTCRMSHGGNGLNWSYSTGSAANGISSAVRRYLAGVERLPEIVERLRHVQVESQPAIELLRRYDSPETLFYLDPPYVPGTRVNGGYRFEMSLDDHRALVDAALRLEGMVVLSGYQSELYEPLRIAGWQIKSKEVTASTSPNRALRTEVLWIKGGIEPIREAV